MFAFLSQFDSKNARKSSMLIFFCQIDVEISKATLKCSTKQCYFVFKAFICFIFFIVFSGRFLKNWPLSVSLKRGYYYFSSASYRVCTLRRFYVLVKAHGWIIRPKVSEKESYIFFKHFISNTWAWTGPRVSVQGVESLWGWLEVYSGRLGVIVVDLCYRGSLDSTNFGPPGDRTIAKIVLSGDLLILY